MAERDARMLPDAAPVLPGEAGKPAMPAEATAELTEAYQAATVILEYGSGGSTRFAAQLPGKTVFSVESDADFLADLQDWLDLEPRPATVHLHHADIGATGKWGAPTDEASFRKWPSYAQSVWDRPDFRHPDVVLVDGRFRLACMATVLARITRPVVMLVDDYRERPAYHRFESLQKPTRYADRMARFELMPQALPGAALPWIVDAHLRPK
jgi:hypothetical protein